MILKKVLIFWKQVLKLLIDIIFTLTSSYISFRGHREIIGETNIGNYSQLHKCGTFK